MHAALRIAIPTAAFLLVGCQQPRERLDQALRHPDVVFNLDLSSGVVGSLPREIATLRFLERLDVRGDSLSQLPWEIGQLQNLREIRTDHNQLSTLPESMGDLHHLEIFTAGWNHLENIPHSLAQLENLRILDLYDNRLRALPALEKLRKLDSLDVSLNPLAELPSGIGGLENLKLLRARRTELRTLPAEIGNLRNLLVLDVQSSGLRELPREIGLLTALQVLWLGREGGSTVHRPNQLTMIPEEIGNLTQLRSLALNDNRLTSLPSSIGKLENLTHLYLGNNRLTEIPPEIGNLRNLVYLDLRGNRLRRLPPEIAMATNLKHLYIDDNDLLSVPLELQQRTNLRIVYSGNPIPPGEMRKLDEAFAGTSINLLKLLSGLLSLPSLLFLILTGATIYESSERRLRDVIESTWVKLDDKELQVRLNARNRTRKMARQLLNKSYNAFEMSSSLRRYVYLAAMSLFAMILINATLIMFSWAQICTLLREGCSDFRFGFGTSLIGVLMIITLLYFLPSRFRYWLASASVACWLVLQMVVAWFLYQPDAQFSVEPEGLEGVIRMFAAAFVIGPLALGLATLLHAWALNDMREHLKRIVSPRPKHATHSSLSLIIVMGILPVAALTRPIWHGLERYTTRYMVALVWIATASLIPMAFFWWFMYLKVHGPKIHLFTVSLSCRGVYALQRFGIDHPKILAAIGVALFTFSLPGLRELARLLF